MIDEYYSKFCKLKSDINEHMPTLYYYASHCKHITEMGVRNVVSTWAFLKSKPKRIICYDIKRSNNIDIAITSAKENGIELEFYEKDVLTVEIEETDLLFIDTLHQYKQLSQELNMHASRVKKYIIIHDTTKFAHTDEFTGAPNGLWPAIKEFLKYYNTEWRILHRYTNNNGLTIMERI